MKAHKKTKSLRPGCYLMWFKPTKESSASGATACIGTFRVTEHDGELRASSDLYSIHDRALDKKVSECTSPGKISRSAPGARGGKIPIFPLEDYRYYLEVLSIEGPPSRVRLSFRGHRFDSLRRTLVPGSNFQVELTGTLPKGTRAATSYPKKLTGGLFKGTEQGARGNLVLQYLGENLRRAELRIIRIQPTSKPKIMIPGKSLPRGVPGWEKLFHDKIGWDLSVSEPDSSSLVRKISLIRPARDEWAPYDLGLAATKLRNRPPLTGDDWVYDLLCVSTFEQHRFLGMMFDAEATDLNDSPRESAAVAALETVEVGKLQGRAQEMFGGRLYYRTALHEVGHAMNLTHTLLDNGIMNTTDFLLPNHSPRSKSERKAMKALDKAFKPDFDFSPKDREWLQHAPDIAVRPGGISRNEVGWICECKKDVNVVSLRNELQAELRVEPVLREIPYGAPVRLNYILKNHGPSLLVPSDISLSHGVLSGRVVGPDRKERYFRSLFRCCDSNSRDPSTPGAHLQKLFSGKSVSHGVTLLRGTDGPLFPIAGNYYIKLEMRWDESGRTNRVVGGTSITILEADSSDPDHDRSAEIALNEPKLMPALVQGLLVDEEGMKALSRTLNSPTLAPHYLPIALHCYSHGQARKFNWKPLLKPSISALRAGKPAAANGQDVARTKRHKTPVPPPLTEVESDNLKVLFQPAPRLKLGQGTHSLDDVSDWLDSVMNTTESTADGKENIRLLMARMREAFLGKTVVQEKPAVQKPEMKKWSVSKSGRRNIQPIVLPKEHKT